jgi:hypothetical protein
MDWIYSIPFIFSLVVLGRGLKKRLSFLWRIILFLEKNSTNIWFLHGIFFTPNRTLQFIAYWPHYGVLIVLWVLIITGGISVLLSPVQKAVGTFIGRYKWGNG